MPYSNVQGGFDNPVTATPPQTFGSTASLDQRFSVFLGGASLEIRPLAWFRLLFEFLPANWRQCLANETSRCSFTYTL